MLTAEAIAPSKQGQKKKVACYHCGTPCLTTKIRIEDKIFCCDGCKLVYEIINSNGLCNYYELQNHPGLANIKPVRNGKYAFLDDEVIAAKLCSFTDGDYSIVTFYIPGVHCSSCMWLLEHLRRLNEGVSESRMNFGAKELTIHFSKEKVSLRQLAELLSTIGYDPYISLEDTHAQQASKPDRKRTYRLGVAAFCFANIMMMSFPEYLGGAGFERRYAVFLRVLNLVLALPVFFFSAGEFFSNAWNGLKAKTLNIDAPIALAILITFSRSLYEITSGTGAGYLDSMSGIVFFMLIGRVVQERTYRSMSFHRDYKSYFPIAVTLLGSNGKETRSLHDLAAGDRVLVHHDEIIPADSRVLEGIARIDYSFVTGESEPVHIEKGGKVYAGGRQTGEGITICIEKPVAGSYLTSLWNHHAFNSNKAAENSTGSSIHTLSRHFTLILFSLALLTGLYWAFQDPSKILGSITAMLIVACPCALLLSATFTNGNLLRIYSNTGLYLRDATVIEQLGNIDHIVFDKTGTLTQGVQVIPCGDSEMNDFEKRLLYTATKSSQHPYSKALTAFSEGQGTGRVTQWREITGEGIEAEIEGVRIRVGNGVFTGSSVAHANVHAKIGFAVFSFVILPQFRKGIPLLIERLNFRFGLSLLSGDNARQKDELQDLFHSGSALLFGQKPIDKLHFIENLQRQKLRVLMIGDGLNDAGALQQSNVGITLADDINNFSPACDAILDAKRITQLPAFLGMAKAGRNIIRCSFAISVGYNLCGLFFAVQGRLSPMIAAILMPASTLTIVLLSTGVTAIVARRLRLFPKK